MIHDAMFENSKEEKQNQGTPLHHVRERALEVQLHEVTQDLEDVNQHHQGLGALKARMRASLRRKSNGSSI